MCIHMTYTGLLSLRVIIPGPTGFEGPEKEQNPVNPTWVQAEFRAQGWSLLRAKPCVTWLCKALRLDDPVSAS